MKTGDLVEELKKKKTAERIKLGLTECNDQAGKYKRPRNARYTEGPEKKVQIQKKKFYRCRPNRDVLGV